MLTWFVLLAHHHATGRRGRAGRLSGPVGDLALSYRLEIQSRGFYCNAPPEALDGGLEDQISATLRGVPGAPPEILYWDLDLLDGARQVGALRFGQGGLDPLLLAERDLSAALAINEHALTTLVRSGSLAAPRDLFRAANLLLRSPATRSLYCPGLLGRTDVTAIGPGPERATGSASSETISIAVISRSADDALAPFLDSLLAQDVSARIEVVVLIGGTDGASNKQRGQVVDAWSQTNSRFRVRRFLLWGDFDAAYLANTAAALANGEVLIIADPACRPQSPTLLQNLADWSGRGDTATVSPRIETADRLFAAGLSLGEAPDGSLELTPFDDDMLCDGPRLAAAPAPWLFAVRRRHWVASGGAPVTRSQLWTGPLAGAWGPKGRHVMLGAETARWTGGPIAKDIARFAPEGSLRSSSLAAIRSPAGDLARMRPLKPRPAQPSRTTPPAQPRTRPQSGDLAAFSDALVSSVPTDRLLVFADAFGPSQSIAFVEGLATARGRGEVAVRILAEAVFAELASDLAARVDLELERFRPTRVVVSRLAEPLLWNAIRNSARRQGVPIVFHIDDDLFGLPIILGIDRYRIGRHPRRLHTLHSILNEADLVLAATPALAARLGGLVGHGRITSMPMGSAAAPPTRRSLDMTRERLTLGYMGSASHNHDLELVTPAINRILKEYPQVDVTLFGSIGKQPAARQIKARLQIQPGVFGDYPAFRKRLSELRFDIGLAPLRDIPFNRVKTATKWVEYAEAGIAVLASDVEPYRPMAEAGALLAVRPDQWEAGLRELIESPGLRQNLVQTSDALLTRSFGWDRMESGLLKLLRSAGVAAMAV